MNIAMIRPRIGSKRLPQKELRQIEGIPLIALATHKYKELKKFDEIWINCEHTAFSEIAESGRVNFRYLPEKLGSDTATSKQFVCEFFTNHACVHLSRNLTGSNELPRVSLGRKQAIT